jgi:hypothetical protein
MHVRVPTVDFTCAPALLSAAELELPVSMPIAGSFTHLSVCFCSNYQVFSYSCHLSLTMKNMDFS